MDKLRFYKSSDHLNLSQRTEYAQGLQNYVEKEMAALALERKAYTLKTPDHIRRRALIEMHGYPLTEYPAYKKLPIKVKSQFLGQDEQAVITRMQLELIPDIWLYGIMYMPIKKIEGKSNPLVIVQHGANDGPEMAGSLIEDSFNYNHMARRFVDRGAVVFAPQLLTWGTERYGSLYDRAKLDNSFRQMGGSFAAMELLLIRRLLDFFETYPGIDNKRIGFAGLSWGGMYALHIGAIDKRVKVVLSSCFFNDRAKINWTDWTNKNQAKRFFDAEVASLVVPRYLCIECGKQDALFPIGSALSEFNRMKSYFKNDNMQKHVLFNAFDGAHEFNPKDDGIDWFFSKL